MRENYAKYSNKSQPPKRKLKPSETEREETKQLKKIKSDIRTIFDQFTSEKHGYIDNPRFRKFLLACQLLPYELAINEVDILYMSAKARYRESQAACGLTFEAFAHALLLIAESLDQTCVLRQKQPKTARTSFKTAEAELKQLRERNQLFMQFIEVRIKDQLGGGPPENEVLAVDEVQDQVAL